MKDENIYTGTLKGRDYTVFEIGYDRCKAKLFELYVSDLGRTPTDEDVKFFEENAEIVETDFFLPKD